MNKSKNKELLGSLADKSRIQKMPSEQARDLVNIVFDALNSTVGGVVITDTNGIIMFVNPSFCKLFEFLPGEIIGHNAGDLFATRKVKNISDVIDIIDIKGSTC